MMTLAKIAARLATSGDRDHRWRQIAVPLSAAAALVAVLAATSVLAMADRQNDRDAARRPVIATEDSDTDLAIAVRTDYWRDEPIDMVWIEPVRPGADTVLPPGVDVMPQPGQAVVSPELDRLASIHPELSRRYPDRLVLGQVGLRTADELIAFVRPAEGRGIDDPGNALRIAGRQVVGEEPMTRVSGFGPLKGATHRSYSAEPVPIFATLLGAGAMLGGPALVILAVGVATGSPVRDKRFQILTALGVPLRSARQMAIVETLILATPGLLLAVAGWQAVAPGLDEVPLVGRPLIAGDMSLPWWLVAVEFAGAAAVCSGLAVLLFAVRRRQDVQPRPTTGRTSPSVLAMLPLAVAAAVLIVAEFLAPATARPVGLVGIGAAVLAAPLAVPILLRIVGGRLSGSAAPAISVAGRSIEWDPKRAARPFVGLAALLALVLSGAAYIAVAKHIEEPQFVGGSSATAVQVSWHEPESGDVKRLEAALDTGLVVPLSQETESEAAESDAPSGDQSAPRVVEPDQGHHGSMTIGATCAELAPYLGGGECTSPDVLPDQMARALARLLLEAGSSVEPSFDLADRADVGATGSALVLSHGPAQAVDDAVRTAAATSLTIPVVGSAAVLTVRASPLVAWIEAGLLLAAASLGLASLLSVVDRLLATRRNRQHLLNIGASPRYIVRLDTLTFVLPYAVVLVVGLGTGLVVDTAVAGLDQDVDMPWPAIGLTTAAALAIGLAGTALFTYAGSRRLLSEAE